jgi:hypothetical protein
MQDAVNSISSGTSAWGEITYSSAAPSTTSMTLRRSSSACDLSEMPTFDTAKTYTVSPTLFGFQLTISYGITKVPQWLHDSTGRNIQSIPVSSASGTNAAVELSPVKVSVVMLIVTFVTLWLAQFISEDLSSYVTASLLLWLVFGGYEQPRPDEMLILKPLESPYATTPEHLQEIGSPVIVITPPEDTRPVVDHDAKLITVVETINFPEVTSDIVELYTSETSLLWMVSQIHRVKSHPPKASSRRHNWSSIVMTLMIFSPHRWFGMNKKHFLVL